MTLEETISKIFLDTKICKFLSEKLIKISNEELTESQFIKYLERNSPELHDILDKELLISYLLIFKDKEEYKGLAKRVFSILKGSLKEKERKERETSLSTIGRRSYSYDGHYKVVDIKSGQSILFNTNTESCLRYDVEEWEEWLIEQNPKNIREAKRDSTIRGLISYDPQDLKPVKKVIEDGQEIDRYNIYVPPEWRVKKLKTPNLPDLFKKLMKSVFPDDESRIYVMNWLYNLVSDRNETHLILHGSKGCGKNKFASICQGLVGKRNSTMLDPSFWLSQFNSELQYRRLVICDEQYVENGKYSKGGNKNKLKMYAGGDISIEAKNKKVGDNEKNFASFIIINNPEDGINDLEVTDRRFSVPILSDKKLEDNGLTEEELELIDRYVEEENEEFFGNIGWWLLKKGSNKKWGSRKALHTPLFHELVRMSMNRWQDAILTWSKGQAEGYDSEGWEINTFIEEATHEVGDKFVPKMTRIRAFLKDTRDEYGINYFFIKKGEGDSLRRVYLNEKSSLFTVKEEEVKVTEEEEAEF